MHPILFRFGSFVIYTYTLTAIIAQAVATIPIVLESRRLKWDLKQPAWWFVTKCTLVGWAGAHIMYALTRFDLSWTEWLSLLFLRWGHGNVWFGGLIASWAYVHGVAKRYQVPVFQMYDTAVFAATLALAFGRWGCFFGGCCYGRPTSLGWGYWVPNVEGYQRLLHPTPVYEFVFLIAVFFYLWRFRLKKKYDGQIAIRYLYLTSVGRFIIEFFRGDTIRGSIFGWVSTSQAIAFGMIAGALVLQLNLARRALQKRN